MPADPLACSGDRLRVAAVVLNYCTPDLVADCLATLLPEMDPARDAIVVVDNASPDGSAEKIAACIAEHAPGRVRLVEAEANGGFSAGHNLGIAAVDASAYLLLNSDTLVRRGAVARLRHALDTQPQAGLVSPRLEWPDATPQVSCFRDHTPWSELIRASATRPIHALLRRYDVSVPVRDAPVTPDWTSFAAVLVRRETLERVGPLDEAYFMYFEDADYCRRARAAGLTVYHEPSARIVHLRGGTSPVKALTAARKRRPRYYYASRSRYFRQAYGRAGLLAANLCWTLGRGVAWLRETLGSKAPHTVERELLDVWRG